MPTSLKLPDVLTHGRPAPSPGEGAVSPPGAAPGSPGRRPQAPSRRGTAPIRFVRQFVAALGDRRTYDPRRNPTLWVGFLLALPIPFLGLAAGSAPWLILLSAPAPLVWAVVLGAAGSVGLRAQEAAAKLAREAEAAERRAQKAESQLGRELERRTNLEQQATAVTSDLRLAQAVHTTLVPASIVRPDVEVAVRQIPCEFVGGDYLHASVVDDRWLYLCVGDVSGHGVAAALVVARLHGLFRRTTLEKRGPESILEELNRAALAILKHTYFFMTVGVFRLDLRAGTLDYATAGHPGQVLLRGDGKVEVLRTPNRLLGMDADIFDADRPSASTSMQEGDTLVLFSDGLFEVLGGSDGDELLGEKQLHKRIASVAGLAPTLMAGEILQDLADFHGESSFEDDVSLMVARWRGPGRDPPTAPPPAPA